ncbi:MAG: DNA recombination protein RmuC [Egibacteraceae bacterium]
METTLTALLAAAAGALVVAALLRRRDSGAPEAISAQLTHMQSQLDRALGLAGELERGRAEQLGMLSAEIRHVHRQGAELADATRDLREALVSTKARGQWGERMADDVLRLAGLIENVNYRKQKALRSGSVPDFTFLLRANLCLHMDVKFPFDNYIRFINTGDERCGDAFLRDVRARVRELAARDYVDPAGGTVDFVLMFVPNDQLLTFIQERDAGLIDDALRHKVVCCSPLSLFPVLQVVRQAAEGLQLEHNIAEIHSLLGAFGRQWEQFTKQLEGLGTHLERAQRAYEDLITTRRRTLERPLEKLNTLRGARQPAALTSPTDTRRSRTGGLQVSSESEG